MEENIVFGKNVVKLLEKILFSGKMWEKKLFSETMWENIN